MGEATKIQWTDHTFNPWLGCAKVHTGCTNCYADRQSRRNPGLLGILGDESQGGTRVAAGAVERTADYRGVGDDLSLPADRQTATR